MIARLSRALSPHGLILRGGFHPEPGEPGLECAATIILVGNAGPAMWEAFAPHIDGERNPLDRWTKRVVDPLAEEFGARALYPFGPDAPPFQRWALRAETLHASPLGILIHPEYGLWHAYRAALLFAERLELPPRADAPSPCESCAEKPCLSACPVGAFTAGDSPLPLRERVPLSLVKGAGEREVEGARPQPNYDVAACGAHIASPEADCLAVGCHARSACPVGEEWRYAEAQTRFHMAAFARSAGPDVGPG